ncbi:MAG: glycosyltransferase family 2 protein, partial [Desulfamplus sp.]|nr:glycosyltransferase family 2 protein [Desulfamplus sp.]
MPCESHVDIVPEPIAASPKPIANTSSDPDANISHEPIAKASPPAVANIAPGPIINILIRTKDRPELLMDALGSVVNQIYRPVKPVIVNDGGVPIHPENISAILREIPFEYIEHPVTMGRSAAFNTG